MSVCLLLIDDGRADYFERCMASLAEALPPIDHQVTVRDPDHELGFAGAVQSGWARALATNAEWVFHAESDFLYEAPIELDAMIEVLESIPHLTQMSLLRQAWNEEEKLAGGIIQAYPDQFVEATDGEHVWVETDRFLFTTNPSVYSTRLCRRGFPNAPQAEGRFGAALRAEKPSRRCGIWGALDDPPRVKHIGTHRTGRGY